MNQCEKRQEDMLIKLKVVTVDDSPLIARRLQQLISELGGVSMLGNAETITHALEIIEQKKPHVLILDIHLSMDKPRTGIDLLALVKKSYPMVKTIMLTNVTEQHYKDLCKSLGADYFFDKSDDFDRIPETLSVLNEQQWMSDCDSWWQGRR
jgi:DNA-binding NarL/FixJ family response regulator